jgi:hypothetical protein
MMERQATQLQQDLSAEKHGAHKHLSEQQPRKCRETHQQMRRALPMCTFPFNSGRRNLVVMLLHSNTSRQLERRYRRHRGTASRKEQGTSPISRPARRIEQAGAQTVRRSRRPLSRALASDDLLVLQLANALMVAARGADQPVPNYR